jgi:NAD(P)-dependent dehydrogenase (short-subunit alcohol dehydrogenase family)
MGMFGADSTADEVVAGHNLSGQNVIVTGGTSGLGRETARALASAGAAVTITGRDMGRGEEAVARVRASTGNSAVRFAELNLGSLASVREFIAASTRDPLHLLIDNAGVMATPLSYTEDGFETQFGVNHLGHFALTVGLLPALRQAGNARVVVLSSRAHRRGDVDFEDPNYRHRPYDPWQAYGQSKSANALFAVGLTQRYRREGILANSLMPGAINTGLQGHLDDATLRGLGWTESEGRLVPPPGWRSVEKGAATSVWAAVAPELDGVGGKYLEDCEIAKPWTEPGDPPGGYFLPRILDPERADRLWTLSEDLTGTVS